MNTGFFAVCASPSRTTYVQRVLRPRHLKEKKIRAVKQAKAQKGERVNGEAPYGYLIDPDNRNHLIPDPETAHVVKQIFAMYVRGDRMCEIQNWLRDNEILTVGGTALPQDREQTPPPPTAQRMVQLAG